MKQVLLLAIMAFTYLCQGQITTDGLVAFFPFNGNANDESRYGNDGSVYGATLTEDRFGSSNSAYEFDGSNDYILIPNSSKYKFSNYSLSFWVKVLGPGTPSKEHWSLICKNDTPDGYNDQLSIFVSQKAFLDQAPFTVFGRIGDGSKSGGTVFNNHPINDSKWHHILYIFDNSNDRIVLYVDNIEVANKTFLGDAINNSAPISIGYWRAYNNFFKGIIDEIRIYDRALTLQEINSLSKEGINQFLSSLPDAPVEKTQNTSSTDQASPQANNLVDRKLKKVSGSFIFPDGSIYEGERKQGYAEGQGRRIFVNGNEYVGQFVSGYFFGTGVLIDKVSGKYEGNFVNDKKEGKGKQIFPNGDVYEGNWQNDSQNGFGKCVYRDESIYEGNWVNGKREGKGKLTSPYLFNYDGYWANDQMHGEGKLIYETGTFYEGAWKNGKRDGFGKYSDRNGSYYEGNWVNDKRNGKGVSVSAEGNRYEGDWKDDVKEGNGKMNLNNGAIYIGEWANNTYNGTGEYTVNNVGTYIGSFRDGNMNGRGELRSTNGDILKGTWTNNNLTGHVENVYSDGTRYVGDYSYSRKNGDGVLFYSDGRKYNGHFNNDLRDGYGKFYLSDGSLYYDGNWMSDEISGYGTLYQEGGKYIGEFSNGMANGRGEFIDASGNKTSGIWQDNSMIQATKDETVLAQTEEVSNTSNTEDEEFGLFSKIIQNLPPNDAAYFKKVVETYNSDPQNRIGKLCGHDYTKCVWCGISVEYPKYYKSRIQAMKDMTNPLVDLYAGAVGGYMIELGKMFGLVEEDPIDTWVKDIQDDLNMIRKNDIYYCEGEVPDFCSEKCRVEYYYYH